MVHKASAEYVPVPGWHEDISGARNMEELPPAARDYLALISDHLGVPIVLVGVGPGRDEVIWTDSPAPRLAAA
jgi:adenylosuccinate synthase